MTLTIGRAGRDDTTNMTINTDTVHLSGNALAIGGWITATDEDDVLALRQQLLGLNDSPDEPVVPIVHSGDPTLSGFYRVVSVDVESPSSGMTQAQGALKWSGQFERVTGFGAPQIELFAAMPLLTNGVGVTGAEVSAVTADDVWLPAAVTETDRNFSAVIVREAADGDLFEVVALSTPPAIETVRFSIPPADYYTSAVSLQVGSSFRTFVGRQAENSVLSSTLDDWRIQNGLVRVSWDTSDDTLVVQHFDGTQWDTAKKYDVWLGGVGNNQIDALVAVRVLANTPERVTVRLALTSSDALGALGAADLTVLRGERMVRITFTRTNVSVWGIARATNEAGTDTSNSSPFSAAAGIRATNNDASGNRYVIACALASDTENTIGAVDTQASVSVAQFMVSTEIGGSGAATVDTADRQILQFLAGTSLTQIVSVR